MSILKNFLYNAAYQLLLIILPLVTAPYLSRVLGPSGLGTYSYTYSVANYFVLIAMLGVNNYGTREVARCGGQEEVRRKFWGIWSLQALLALTAALLYCLYSYLFAPSFSESIVWLPYVFTALLDVNWLFFGLQRFRATVIRSFLVKLVTFVATLLVVRGDGALVNYLTLTSLSLFVSAIVLWPLVLRELPPLWMGWREVLTHLKPNLVLFVPVIAVSFYTVLDKVMLGYISGMRESGIFENSLKVAQMPFAFISALGAVMLPHASQEVTRRGCSGATASIGPSMWFAMLLASAFTFGLMAVSPEFCPVFFGPGFDECARVMSLIVLEMPFMAWANVIRTQWLIPTGLDRAYIASVAAGAVCNVAVNLVLIPLYGAMGAAVATLAAEVAVCAVQTAAVLGELPLKRWALESIPSMIIGLMMFIVVRIVASCVEETLLGLFTEVIIGAFVYCAVSILWLFISRNEYAYVFWRSVVRSFSSRRAC